MTSLTGDQGREVPFDPDIELGRPDLLEPGHRSGPARRDQAVVMLALAGGGMAGALGRYAISLAVPTGPDRFPWDTFLINVSGSAVLGFLLILVIEWSPGGRLARPMLGTGFLGAYTTFSTFMVEAVELVRHGHPVTAAVYLAASVVAGLVAVWLGMAGARVALRAERRLQEGRG